MMIEKLLYDFLTARIDVPVYMEMPASPPEAFVLMEKTGGGMSNHLRRATIAVQTYDASLYKTAGLNEVVKTAMLSCAELDAVARCELNSDYCYTDTTHKLYRYQAVFDVIYYEV